MPLVTDTGTAALQSVASHVSSTCGPLLYTPSGALKSLVIKDNTNLRHFTFDLGSDYSLVGDHKLMISVTSIDYPTEIAPLTLEIVFTVKNPCLDTNYRKFDEMLSPSEIIFPIGSSSTSVNVTWPEINFDQIANMTEACGPPLYEFISPSILTVEELVKGKPQSGVMLSLPSLGDNRSFTEEDFENLQVLTVQAYYKDYESTSGSDIILQEIRFVACDCDDGLVEKAINIPISVAQKQDFLYTFEAPRCSIVAIGCRFDWAFDLRMQDEKYPLDSSMFFMNEKTGELRIRAQLMKHVEKVVR